MANVNEVRLIGRLTRDPESRSTATGAQVATFGLATSRKYKDSRGDKQEEVCFVDITCWGKLADIVGKYLQKGRLVYVGGRLRLEQWEDKQTGGRRSKLSVVADNVQFLEYKDNGQGQQRQPQQQQGAPDNQRWSNNNADSDNFDPGDPPF